MKQIYTGGKVKMTKMDDHHVKVKGLGVLFDTKDGECDLEMEYFTKDTYFGHRKGDMSEAMFHHGVQIVPDWAKGFVPDHLIKVSKDLALMKFSNPVRTTLEEEGRGLMAELVLDMRKEYEKFVAELVDKKALSWSSGAMPGARIDRETGEIKNWVIGEFSLTPIPAEPRATVDIAKSTNFNAEVIRTIFGEEVHVPVDALKTDEAEKAFEVDMLEYKWAKMKLARSQVLNF